MPRRKPFEENGVYHIYNRGFNKQKIFFNKNDYEKFFSYLEFSIDLYKDDLKIFAYSVLPNHFHFMIQSKKEGLFISDFMRQVQASYTSYLRVRYPENFERGSIFEGRFKVKEITSEEYFNKCFYYVNYNAVKHGIVDKIEDYPYSSIHQFLNGGQKKIGENSIKVNYSLNGPLKEFFENFEDFEF